MHESHRAARWSVSAAALAWCLAFPVPEAAAQTPIWLQLPPPASVGLHVRDSQRDRELFFDESGLLAVPDAPVTEWQRVWTGTNPASAARDFAFYDPARDRIWTVTRTLSDTLRLWTMDLSGAPLVWTPQPYTWAAPGLAGSVVQYGAFAFDPVRDRVVTFGGYSSPAGATDGVYSLTLSGTPQWTHEAVNGPGPGPRFNVAMTYDPWRDRMLVFGGLSYGPVYYDETWALSLGTPMSWSFLTPTQLPPPGQAPEPITALDSLGWRWFVLGGGTWALDLSSSTPADAAVWTQIDPGPNDPRPLTSGALFEQPGQSRLVSYGGADLWTLSLGATPAWAQVGGDSLGLVRREGLVAFVDDAHQRLYAGLGPDDSFQYRPLDQDVPWVTLTTHGPSARYSAVAVTDVTAGRALVFGGGTEFHPDFDGDEYSDLWSFGFDGAEWTPLTPAGPPLPRAAALGVFDSAHRRLVVHGGRYTNPGPTALGDTWVFDAVGGTWSSPAAGNYGERWGEVGIYDPVRDRVIAFGGTNAARSVLSDVHVLPLGSAVGAWSELATNGTPPGWMPVSNGNFVEALAAAYDSLGDRMIVMAGLGPETSLWELTLDGPPTWGPLSPAGSVPAQRFGAALVNDPARQRILMTGGAPVDYGRSRVGDTWALYFDATTPTQLALVSADATPDQVTLRWYAGGAGPASATVYRRGSGEEWRASGRQGPDGTGVITWIDSDVVPGAGYDYRLGVEGPGGERFYGETHIVVPVRSTLSLEGTRPNPGDGRMLVTFSLANRAPATLELLDVAGRRLLGREVGSLGAGAHVVRLDADGVRPAAGLYFLRLVQDGRACTAKVVIAR